MKPKWALQHTVDCDLSETSLLDAIGQVGLEMGFGGLNYHLGVSGFAYVEAQQVLARFHFPDGDGDILTSRPIVIALSIDQDFEDYLEWCLTAYRVEGGEINYKQVWSPGA